MSTPNTELMKPSTPVIWRVNQDGQIVVQKTGVVVGTGSEPDSILVKFDKSEDRDSYERWVSRGNVHVLEQEKRGGKGM